MSYINRRFRLCFALCAISVAGTLPASVRAQIKPETSGKSSFYEPEMRPHGSGEYRPNMPGKPLVSRSRYRHGRMRFLERK